MKRTVSARARVLWRGERRALSVRVKRGAGAIGPFTTVLNLSVAAIHQPRHAVVTSPTLIHLRLTFSRPLCILRYNTFCKYLVGNTIL